MHMKNTNNEREAKRRRHNELHRLILEYSEMVNIQRANIGYAHWATPEALANAETKLAELQAEYKTLREKTMEPKYDVKCDDCKATIRTTSDVKESYAGGRCATCTKPKTADLSTALGNFVAKLQERENNRIARDFPNLTPETFEAQQGRTYARIVKGGSAYCFVALKDVSTKHITAQKGDILKAASYKAPAPHKRGSILADNQLNGTNEYGANYIVR